MTEEQTPSAAEPTPEQQQQLGNAGGQALAEAVQQGDTPDQARERVGDAVKEQADKIDFKLSEEDRTQLVDQLIERMQALGAFDPPPPPEPAPAAAPATPAGDAPPASPPADPPPAEPQKRSWAQKFMGAE